ncbi:MAG: hypothetical protein FWC01_04785 [Treponema sp.]|nr:hypothetical protein [Treponema sp.]MCL2237274.1 hypothetical protein [Treponema sp.]
MAKMKPLFYCDNCGYEVGDDLKKCPYCGRNFVSVRCPICDYSGPDKIFQDGCPMCGYSAPPQRNIPKPPKSKPRKFDEPPSQPLPFWTFIAAFFALIAVIFLFSHLITR